MLQRRQGLVNMQGYPRSQHKTPKKHTDEFVCSHSNSAALLCPHRVPKSKNPPSRKIFTLVFLSALIASCSAGLSALKALGAEKTRTVLPPRVYLIPQNVYLPLIMPDDAPLPMSSPYAAPQPYNPPSPPPPQPYSPPSYSQPASYGAPLPPSYSPPMTPPMPSYSPPMTPPMPSYLPSPY